MSKDLKKTLFKSLLVFVSYFFYQDLIALPLNLLGVDLGHLTSGMNFAVSIYYVVCHLIFVGILIFLYRDMFKKDLKDLKEHKLKRLIEGVLFFIVALFAFNLVIGILSNFVDISSFASDNQTSIEAGVSQTPFYSFMLVVVCLPLIEQITFKKTVRDLIDNKWFFILFSSVIYGFFNVVFAATGTMDYLKMIPYFVQSAILCYLYYKEDNLTLLMLMIMINNTIGFIVSSR